MEILRAQATGKNLVVYLAIQQFSNKLSSLKIYNVMTK